MFSLTILGCLQTKPVKGFQRLFYRRILEFVLNSPSLFYKVKGKSKTTFCTGYKYKSTFFLSREQVGKCDGKIDIRSVIFGYSLGAFCCVNRTKRALNVDVQYFMSNSLLNYLDSVIR